MSQVVWVDLKCFFSLFLRLFIARGNKEPKNSICLHPMPFTICAYICLSIFFSFSFSFSFIRPRLRFFSAQFMSFAREAGFYYSYLLSFSYTLSFSFYYYSFFFFFFSYQIGYSDICRIVLYTCKGTWIPLPFLPFFFHSVRRACASVVCKNYLLLAMSLVSRIVIIN